MTLGCEEYFTSVVSQGEAGVQSSFLVQKKEEVMSILWIIWIDCTQSLNDLKEEIPRVSWLLQDHQPGP